MTKFTGKKVKDNSHSQYQNVRFLRLTATEDWQVDITGSLAVKCYYILILLSRIRKICISLLAIILNFSKQYKVSCTCL